MQLSSLVMGGMFGNFEHKWCYFASRMVIANGPKCAIRRNDWPNKLAQPHRVQCKHFAVFHGFQFDPVMDSTSAAPEAVVEADQVAMVSLKNIAIPATIRNKIETMLKNFGHKKDVERVGMFIARKLASRSSVELPRALPSSLFHMKDPRQPAFTALKLQQNNEEQASSLLEAGALPNDFEGYNQSVAHAEDARHKLYKISYFPEAALSFVAHRYAPMFASCFRVLFEIKKRAPHFTPRTMLEYGAGAAPGIAAAHAVWNNGFVDALAIEASVNLSHIGSYLTEDLPYVRWQYNLYENTQSFDLIILSYSLLDVSNHESRLMLIRNLWNRVSINGVLVIVESGTPTGFRLIHHTRELFITELGSKKFYFVAPCPHESVCPLALTGKDWCHFGQKIEALPQSLYRKSKGSKSNVQEEKFSYLAIRKGVGPREKYQSQDDAPDSISKSYFWPRIVLPVIKAGKHVLVDVCSSPNSFERLVVTKAAPEAAGYRFARKALWGDLWRFKKRIIRPEARQYTPEEMKNQIKRLSDKLKAKQEETKLSDALEEEMSIKIKQNFGS